MNVKTWLKKDVRDLFEEKRLETGMSRYQFASKLIEDGLKKKITNFNELEKTNDITQDAKALAESEISTKMIEGAIKEMDRQSKTKNSIKKTGAFHEENAVIDIKSMVMNGKPSFYELKYHFDWWYHMSILVNALAMRGVRMKPEIKQFLDALDHIPAPYKQHSKFEDKITDRRARRM